MPRSPWRPRRVARAAAVLLLGALGSLACAISYTVQVIAVSDQDGAIAIYRDLARDGYPAYVVRTTGAQGDVYRVRVGAFANRAAALRYAESMPDVAGSRPVPALAEAIPQGIMPLAPRLLWQHEPAGERVRVLPWPGGVALRVQGVEAATQATYVVFQDGEERRFEAWAALPLRELPELPDLDLVGVPMVDLTVDGPDETAGEAVGDAAGDEPADAVGDAPADDGADDEEVPPAAEDPEESPGDAETRAGDDDDLDWTRFVARPDDEEPEVGLALLRDRRLWPPSWRDDDEAVRDAFRSSLVTIVARALDVAVEEVSELVYLPGGEPPPALVVLDVTDPSGRDAGGVVALADPERLSASGAELVLPPGAPPELPAWPSTRIRPDAAPQEPIGGDDWTAEADAAFVRLRLPDGATWRAGVGAPLWSDGRVVLAWDGRQLLLYDFVPR